MDSDTSDILGGPTFPNARHSQSGWWSSLPFGAKLVFALMVSFVFYVVFVRIRGIFLVWREKAYKLSMRRRHGIPDNDHRPFNVAYAAVLRSRQEGEEKARRARLQELIQDQQSVPPDPDSRQRISRGASTKSNVLPGRYESADNVSCAYSRASGSHPLRPSLVSNLDAQDHYNPKPAVRIADPEIIDSPPEISLSRRAVKDASRKHVHNGGDDSNYIRKMRIKDEFELCGDEEFEWIEEHSSPRGWKRGHGDNFDEDEVDDSLHIRDKRQRKVSLDKSSQLVGEDMDIDEDEDEITALPSLSRGKKRDRAEAGSTFGGDDEDDGDREIDLEQARYRHRKRRTYAKRKSDASVSSRGTKRDRELAEGDSEGENEENMSVKTSRKKRGKKAARAPQPDDRSDVSMDESLSSSRNRPRRNIGDEWESNGVKYKIGPNGQRLRQTLVRKERQKFPMPEDSQHPDRQANLEVYVETWLTEEEYREAKDQQLLAWQDSNKPSAEPQTPTLESPEEVPLAAGKDLLWNSTSSHTQPGGTSTPRQITPPITPQIKQRSNDSFGSSTALNVGLRINPFVNPPTAGKRISTVRRPSSLKLDGASIVPSSSAGSIVHSLSDSTNNSPRHKAFSKWEKQDLEAKAMMKMRQANRVKEEERLEKLKKESEAAAAPSQVIPTITVTTVDNTKPSETKQSAFSFATPPVSDSTKKDAPNPSFLAGPAKETTQLPLLAPATSQPTTKLPPMPAPATTAASTAGNQPTKPTGGLFGSKPEQLNSFVSFGPSAASMPSSTSPATSASAPTNPGIPTSKPAFSFGPTPSQAQPTQATKESEKKNEPAAGGSLLSRLAPSSTPMPAIQATQPSQATSPFGSTKPLTVEPPKTASVFGNTDSAQSSSSQPSTASTGPKFDFGVGKSPVGGMMAATSSAATSGSSAAKPAASPFTFATTSSTDKSSTVTSSTTPASTATDGTTMAPKFSFSIPSSSNPNSFAPKTNGTHMSTATTTAPAQSAFNFGSKSVGTGASTLAPPPFGAFGAQNASAASVATTTPPAQSLLGSFGTKPNGASTATSVQPAFGNQQVPATAPAQSVFSFGITSKPSDNSSTPSVFGTQTTTGASAPAPAQSAFGTASTSGSTSSAFGSNSGFGSKPSGDSSSAPASAQSAFGGFGGSNHNTSTASSSFGSSFSFGKPATSTSTTAPVASKDNASKPIFSFGKPAVASSSTTPLMTPSSTPAPTSTGGSSAFGSSSSSAFTFGSATKNPSITPQTSTDSPFGKPADASAFGFGGGNAFSGFGKAPASTGQQQQ